MKYYFILLFSLLFLGCSENNPKTVAKKFLIASARMDYKGAKNLQLLQLQSY